jgi:hypothetical protein
MHSGHHCISRAGSTVAIPCLLPLQSLWCKIYLSDWQCCRLSRSSLCFGRGTMPWPQKLVCVCVRGLHHVAASPYLDCWALLSRSRSAGDARTIVCTYNSIKKMQTSNIDVLAPEAGLPKNEKPAVPAGSWEKPVPAARAVPAWPAGLFAQARSSTGTAAGRCSWCPTSSAQTLDSELLVNHVL